MMKAEGYTSHWVTEMLPGINPFYLKIKMGKHTIIDIPQKTHWSKNLARFLYVLFAIMIRKSNEV